jgi:hypothetical protein
MFILYVVLSIAAAALFFELRRRRPFIYGVFECAVGFLGLMFTFYPQTSYFLADDASPSGLFLSRGIAVVGGIYLLVRGMENMERDLPGKLRPLWNTFFSKRDEQTGG